LQVAGETRKYYTHCVKSHRFEALDGLRGFAALAVLLLHFGNVSTPWLSPHGALAVDFFFLLSGFVIASAYEVRLQAGQISVVSFVKLRVIRLYPLIFVGALLGTAGYFRVYDRQTLAIVLLTGLALIPTPLAPASESFNAIPANPPSWSLFIELWGNVLYALVARWLTNRVLLGLIVLFGLTLAAACWEYNGINFGAYWPDLWGGGHDLDFLFLRGLGCFASGKQAGFRNSERRCL
jgi:peptidoglycan/LPS O-acetylase OafA/YrhL